MGDFMPTPYRGVPGVPHVSEDFFSAYFIGAQLAMGMLLLPGRVFGSELRPRRHNRDYVIAMCDEHARTREAARGKRPRTFVMRPKEGHEDNWHIKWWKQLHRRRWMKQRMGGGCVKQV